MNAFPPRLYQAQMPMAPGDDIDRAEAIGTPVEWVDVPCVIDLDAVSLIHVGENHGVPNQGEAVVFVQGQAVTVSAPYADIVRAWTEWRTHADHLRRLTN